MPGKENTEQEHQRGRYYAEYLRVAYEERALEHIQERLDDAERKEWHLVGVAGGLPDGGMILFWDTARPSFGRTSR